MRAISSADWSASMEKTGPGGTCVPRKTGSPLITPGRRTMTGASAEGPPAMVSMIATRARNSTFDSFGFLWPPLILLIIPGVTR